MSPASFLLRLLLAVSLVVTTTGGALASMRMHLAQLGESAAVLKPAPAPMHSPSSALAVADASDSAPCHDEPAASSTPHHTQARDELPSPPADHGDCCLGGDCDDICLLSLPPLPSSAFIAAAPMTRAYRIEAHADRPAPRLTRPQRPPIA